MQIAIEVSSALQSAISVPTSRLQTRSLTQNQDFDEDSGDLMKRILEEFFKKKCEDFEIEIYDDLESDEEDFVENLFI